MQREELDGVIEHVRYVPFSVQRDPRSDKAPSMAVATQDFEHEISNILDKPTKSFLGYINIF